MSDINTQKNFHGKILKGVGGIYTVLLNDGKKGDAKPRGILRKAKFSPYPGDNVILSESGDPDVPFCIDSILQRNNRLIRPAVTNIDVLLITVSVNDPPPDYFFAEKMIILSLKSNIEPVICVTKSDMDPDLAKKISGIYTNAGFTAFITGEGTETDHQKLLEFTKGRTISFAGLSGTGKSTLFNRLTGTLHMDTGSISEKNRKGKHTTRHSELIKFNDGFIADTPGFSTLEITQLGVTGLQIEAAYPELKKISDMCRFAGCRHMGENGCAADQAVIDHERLERYRYFRKEVDSIPEHVIRKMRGGE